MSEANIPDNNQDLPESANSDLTWYSGREDFSSHDDSGAGVAEPGAEPEENEWQDWQTVDFPTAMKVDAIARQAPLVEEAPPNWAAQAAPAAAIDLPPWAQSEEPTGDQPQVADLISLIQELNHCNSALIDRVTQLEDALDRSENALQAEIGRSQELSVSADMLTAVQDQIAQLASQLDIAEQTNQQQQALIETMTVHLESGQERVAQLERECASLQQRFSEQSHQLVQRETLCRDLHIRLQRQQRYTLQFKAALEKCLEVPPLNYEPIRGAEANNVAPFQPLYETRSNLTAQPFLPKVQRIQPWSSMQAQPLSGKMKLEALMNPQPDAQAIADVEINSNMGISDLQPDAIGTSEEMSTPAVPLPEQPSDPDLTSNPFSDVPSDIALEISSDTVLEALPKTSPETVAISSDMTLTDLAQAASATTSDTTPDIALEISSGTTLKNLKTSSEVSSDRSPDTVEISSDTVLRTPANASAKTPPEISPTIEHPSTEASELLQDEELSALMQPLAHLSPEAIQAGLAELKSALGDLWTGQHSEAAAEDAETVMWQDIAKLIDVSTDDVLKASQAGDFAAFETEKPDQSAKQPEAAPPAAVAPPAAIEPTAVKPLRVNQEPQLPLAKRSQAVSVQKLDTAQKPSTSMPAASSPSPVVYPLRPTKKLESLAAVDLPTFPR